AVLSVPLAEHDAAKVDFFLRAEFLFCDVRRRIPQAMGVAQADHRPDPQVVTGMTESRYRHLSAAIEGAFTYDAEIAHLLGGVVAEDRRRCDCRPNQGHACQARQKSSHARASLRRLVPKLNWVTRKIANPGSPRGEILTRTGVQKKC